MVRIIIFIALLFSAGSIRAQFHSISGVVTSTDGSIVVGAHVQLPSLEKGTTTDMLGRYKISGIPTGQHVVIISLLGHQRVEKNVEFTNDVVHDARLLTSPIELREVSVRSNSAAGSDVIQALDIRTRPINNSQDLLTMVPGLFIAQHAGGGKAEQIFFRGFDIDHGTDLYISVDGMPVNMVSHAHGQGYADLHFTIPETMEKLVVHKGPYDARFGDFATSGTVEFKTKNFIDKNLIKLEHGMFNTTRAVGIFDLLGKKHLLSKRKESAYIAGEYAYTDAFFQSKQNFGRFNIFGKYTGELSERTHLTLSASTFDASWDASGQIPVRAVESGLIDRFGAIDDTEGGSTSRSNAYATLITGLRNGSSFKNQIYFVKYDFDLYSNFTFFAEDSLRGDMIAQTDDREIMGYTGTYSWSAPVMGKTVAFNTGAGIRHDRADISLKNAVQRVVYDTIVAGSVEQINMNAFIDANVPLTERLSVNAAARIDVFHFNYNDARGQDTLSGNALQHRISPKLSFTYAASERTEIYLRNGIGFHSNDARAVVIGQAARTLPRAYGSDLGTTFKPTQRMVANVALWGLYLENELIYVGDAGVVETSDPTRRIGMDFSVRYQL
ncbi:MAG: TonB-dependent receptor, partial [Bacteroidota bacterium]|nr:TonB-dependent receptor [Bacteroidota bacterium]